MTDDERRSNAQDIKDIKKSLFDDIKPMVYRQSGQWRILLGIFVVFILAIWSSNVSQEEKLTEIQTALVGYISQHSQESKDGFRMIHDHEDRLRNLEK